MYTTMVTRILLADRAEPEYHSARGPGAARRCHVVKTFIFGGSSDNVSRKESHCQW